MARRKLDFYETGQHAVSELMKRVPLGLEIIEPCVGRGAISAPPSSPVLAGAHGGSAGFPG